MHLAFFSNLDPELSLCFGLGLRLLAAELSGPASHQWFVLLLAASALGPCPTENGTGCELSQMLWQMTLHWKVFVTNYVSIKNQSISQCAKSEPSQGPAIDSMWSIVHLI